MIRYRRYRAFMAFSIIAIFATYYFVGHGSSVALSSAIGVGSLKKAGDAAAAAVAVAAKAQAQAQAGVDSLKPAESKDKEKEQEYNYLTNLPTPAATSLVASTTSPTAPPAQADDHAAAPAAAIIPVHELDDMPEVGQGRLEVPHVMQPGVIEPVIHWIKQPEHFPVASTIQLPKGTPKALPRIQHNFPKESSTEKAERLEKLKVIEKAIAHAWAGYSSRAWMKDEVKPVTGGSRDPFCGWAATLVDSLDTLWIVGMKDDFEAAVKAVGDIDFTTSQRQDIPLFETTIRYLGGMLSAYDLSGAQYRILLDKAVELADVLMGAFDTPNRMPLTYYRWMPTFASQPHRAGTHDVLAELGSLSMEFTRLAQLTKEPKYYDAVDRITNAFLEWQNASAANATLIPGLFPINVDASGCEKPAQIKSHYSNPAAGNAPIVVGDGKPPIAQRPASNVDNGLAELHASGPTKSEKGPPAAGVGKIIGWDDPLTEGDLDNKKSNTVTLSKEGSSSPELNKKIIGWDEETPRANTGSLDKRQLEDIEFEKQKEAIFQEDTQARMHTLQKEVCIPRGLASSNSRGVDVFTIGGMADSVYEYFPKQYLLLGGLEEKYKTLYEQSITAVTKHLLFRPMTPQNADILFAGEFAANGPNEEGGALEGTLNYEGAHLTCFAGGMYALGARIFGRDEDLELGAKLTEGCVWSYNATNTGIMPERFLISACENMTDCTWNETKYWEDLDPYAQSRTQAIVAHEEMNKRQLDGPATTIDHAPAPAVPNSVPELDIARARNGPPASGNYDHDDYQKYTPPTPPTHEEYVLARISEERLPAGMTRLISRKYILRPEAIESVFYMYRITGSAHWRTVGWQMWQAIHKYTYTAYGASAIDDVTKSVPEQVDSQESFWMAETLKYFYLLFEEEGVVSLDEWVLNTEAHPFRRPVAGVLT